MSQLDANGQTSTEFEGAPAASSVPVVKARKTARIVIALVLFVALLVSSAWVVQYLAGSGQKRNAQPAPVGDIVHFLKEKGLWDSKDDDYAQEFERGKSGSYEFLFENRFSGQIQVGVDSVSCNCSDVEAALIPPELVKQRKDPRQGRDDHRAVFASADLKWVPVKQRYITIPESGQGLLRMTWKAVAKDAKPQRLRLTAKVWSQPRGKTIHRQWTGLETTIRVVPAVMFTADDVSVGTLPSGGKAEVDVFGWSATRDQLDLRIANDDPLIQWTPKVLSAQECRLLEDRLRTDGDNTRVRAAFKLSVTVNETKNGKHLDQGPFQQRPSFRDGEALPSGLPVVHGRVRGEVDIKGLDENGRMQLGNFKAKKGTQHRLVLRTDPKAGLALESTTPSSLDVKLREDPKPFKDGKKSWLLDVIVPPSKMAGPMADESAILLRTNTDSPRRIRIPLVGTAVD